jgi:SAM-dependent methyltransferase
MLIGDAIGYRLLNWISPAVGDPCPAEAERPAPGKLAVHWGAGVWRELEGKTVIDFGCGYGAEAIDMARHGARSVTGIDIRPGVLAAAAEAARAAGVGHLCTFAPAAAEKADVIISVDAFEHFDDPAAVLRTMAALLKPDGCVLASFGPPWLHPHGGHLFSVFPWSHLLFTEKALLRWRSQFRADGATRFREVEGGLNQMTVRRFERLVAESDFRFASFEAVPIRAARLVQNRLTREFLTSLIRCKLVKKRPGPDPA